MGNWRRLVTETTAQPYPLVAEQAQPSALPPATRSPHSRSFLPKILNNKPSLGPNDLIHRHARCGRNPNLPLLSAEPHSGHTTRLFVSVFTSAAPEERQISRGNLQHSVIPVVANTGSSKVYTCFTLRLASSA